MPDRSELRALSIARGEAERKKFSQRPDAKLWEKGWRRHIAQATRWEAEFISRWRALDKKLDIERAARIANDAWERALKANLRKASGEGTPDRRSTSGQPPRSRPPAQPPVQEPLPPGGWNAVLASLLAAGQSGGIVDVRGALEAGVNTAAWAEGAQALYARLAIETSQMAGQAALDALGLNETFSWATYRDFQRDRFKVRGSKILQHAYGEHLDQLAKLVIRKCDPRHPLTIDQLVKQIRAEWPALSRANAMRIARTEAAAVWEHTNWYALKMNGVEEVDWLIAHGPALDQGKVGPVCPLCLKRKQDAPYPTKGDDALDELPPIHPNCRCTVVPVISPEWLPPAQPWTGAQRPMPELTPAQRRRVHGESGEELVTEEIEKSFGWSKPAGGWVAPALKSPLVGASQAARRTQLTAAQLRQRREAARRKKRRRVS